jgi:hypothetical protein
MDTCPPYFIKQEKLRKIKNANNSLQDVLANTINHANYTNKRARQVRIL